MKRGEKWDFFFPSERWYFDLGVDGKNVEKWTDTYLEEKPDKTWEGLDVIWRSVSGSKEIDAATITSGFWVFWRNL